MIMMYHEEHTIPEDIELVSNVDNIVNKNITIEISDPLKFWSVSKYLVVQL